MYSARKRILSLALTGVMAALSIVLLFVVPEIVIIPSLPHLRVEFSNIPALITSVLCGPGYGIAVVFIKSVLQLLATQSPSFGIGEFINFCMGTILVLTIWLIWRDTTKGFVRYCIACIATIAASVLGGMLLNMALVPLYGYLMGMKITTGVWWGFVTASIPLNILKPAITTLPVYPILLLLKKLMPRDLKKKCDETKQAAV